MRNIPQLTSNAVSKDHIDEFKGYNHNERIQNTEWYGMQNMTTEYYPVASPREKRSLQYSVKGTENKKTDFNVLPKAIGLTYANKELITLQPVGNGAWFFQNGLPIMLNNAEVNIAFNKVSVEVSQADMVIKTITTPEIKKNYLNSSVSVMIIADAEKHLYKKLSVTEVAENYIKLSGNFDTEKKINSANVKMVNVEKFKTLTELNNALKNKIMAFNPTNDKDRVDGRKRSLVKNGSYICSFPDGIVYESNNKDDEIPVKQIRKISTTKENELWELTTAYRLQDGSLTAIYEYDNVNFRVVDGSVQRYLTETQTWVNIPTFIQIAVDEKNVFFQNFEVNNTIKIKSDIFASKDIANNFENQNTKIIEKAIVGNKSTIIIKGYLNYNNLGYVSTETVANKFDISDLKQSMLFCTLEGRQYLRACWQDPNIVFACYAYIKESGGWTLPVLVSKDPGGRFPDGSYSGAEGYMFHAPWIDSGHYSKITTINSLEFNGERWYYTTNSGAMPGNLVSTEGTLVKAEGDFETTKDVALYMLEQYYSSNCLEISRQCPEIAFACESQNRVWGCSKDGHEIYASALGNPYEYYDYSGLSTDSYAVNVGTDDEFTGCCNYLGYPIFFKENSAHLISGNYPAQYAVTTLTEFRGVEKGSEKSLVVIDNILYYKSAAGIVAFDGASAVVVSEQLGNEHYKNAVAGSYNGKYYVSMENSKGEYNLFVFDTRKGTWCKEDNTELWQTINIDNQLIYSDGQNINCISDENVVGWNEYKSEDDVDWFAETGIFGYSYANQKYISRLQVRMYLEIGSRANLYIQYDSDGVWHSCGREIVGKGIQSFLFPIRPRRCDHMQIKISGKGQAKIYSITKMFEEGSDVVCYR